MPSPPSTPTQKHLTRDQRLKILTLRGQKKSYHQISRMVGCTYRQAHYICSINKATPRKCRGRYPKLSEDRLTSVIDWIRATFDNRCKTVDQIVIELNLPVCGETLRKALKARGMAAYPAAKKPAARSRYPTQGR